MWQYLKNLYASARTVVNDGLSAWYLISWLWWVFVALGVGHAIGLWGVAFQSQLQHLFPPAHASALSTFHNLPYPITVWLKG